MVPKDMPKEKRLMVTPNRDGIWASGDCCVAPAAQIVNKMAAERNHWVLCSRFLVHSPSDAVAEARAVVGCSACFSQDELTGLGSVL